MRILSVGVLAVWVLSGCAVHHLPAPVARITRARLPSFKHVFVVVEENQGYASVIGNTEDMPYLNGLAAQYGLATNYYADAHPSINNYFFLTAGHMGTFAPWIRDLADLFPFDVGGENVASILSDNGKSWKLYAESIPGTAYVGDDHGLYVKRHNPFAYFDTVRGKASQRRNIVPFGELAQDLRKHSLPAYSFIVPNVYDDGHNDPETKGLAACGDHRALQDIDGWLKRNINPVVESTTFQRDGLLIITFDEACEYGVHADWRFDPDKPELKGGGRVATVVVSSRTPPGTKSATLYHHENVLRLSLRALGVEHLPGLAANTTDMNDFFPARARKP